MMNWPLQQQEILLSQQSLQKNYCKAEKSNNNYQVENDYKKIFIDEPTITEKEYYWVNNHWRKVFIDDPTIREKKK